MKTTTNSCFSNGTEFMMWQDRNCCKCVKATWYNEKTDTYPQYRCSIQRDIEGQAAGLHEINQRSYDIVQSSVCPYQKTEKAPKKKRVIKNMGGLFE